MRLTWRREPHARGLAGVCQGERGWDLRADGCDIAHVRPLLRGRRTEGYYWYSCHSSLPEANTSASPTSTPEEAKDGCEFFARTHLRSPAPEGGPR